MQSGTTGPRSCVALSFLRPPLPRFPQLQRGALSRSSPLFGSRWGLVQRHARAHAGKHASAARAAKYVQPTQGDGIRWSWHCRAPQRRNNACAQAAAPPCSRFGEATSSPWWAAAAVQHGQAKSRRAPHQPISAARVSCASWKGGQVGHPTDPSSFRLMSWLTSAANSSGSSLKTSLQGRRLVGPGSGPAL